MSSSGGIEEENTTFPPPSSTGPTQGPATTGRDTGTVSTSGPTASSPVDAITNGDVSSVDQSSALPVDDRMSGVNPAIHASGIKAASPFPGQVITPAGPSSSAVTAEREYAARKRKWGMMGFEPDEMGYLEQTYVGLNAALLMDQYSTLYPSPPSAFESYEDAVDRLLPYHIWQIHDEELEGYKVNGKVEAGEIQDADSLANRVRNVKSRFEKTRRREADHPSPLAPLISIINDDTSRLREDVNALQSTLRPIRAEYTVLENEAKRILDERRKVEDEKRRAMEDKRRLEELKLRIEEDRKRLEERKKTREEEEKERLARLAASASTPAARVVPTSTANGQSMSTPTRPLPSSVVSTSTAPISNGASPSTSSERGRPRGRPRGRGRGGMRETTTPHNTGTPATSNGSIPATGPGAPIFPPPTYMRSAAPASTPVASAGFAAPGPATPPVPPNAANISTQASVAQPASAATKDPVSLTVATSLLPKLASLGLMTIPPDPRGRSIANVIRTSEDKQTVVLSILLAACDKHQLVSLAKLLNVAAKMPESGGVSPSSGATANGAGANGASPSK
ncbi:hypothetical protein IAU60_005993 [Kwoniella sp. DSM 27419]